MATKEELEILIMKDSPRVSFHMRTNQEKYENIYRHIKLDNQFLSKFIFCFECKRILGIWNLQRHYDFHFAGTVKKLGRKNSQPSVKVGYGHVNPFPQTSQQKNMEATSPKTAYSGVTKGLIAKPIIFEENEKPRWTDDQGKIIDMSYNVTKLKKRGSRLSIDECIKLLKYFRRKLMTVKNSKRKKILTKKYRVIRRIYKNQRDLWDETEKDVYVSLD